MGIKRVRAGSVFTPVDDDSDAILALGELGIDEDSGSIKVGNGTAAFNALPSLPVSSSLPTSTTIVTDPETGNVTSVTEDGVTTTYTYNDDGSVDTDTRLGVTRQYSYDADGNLTTIEEV